ncbi:hypothetical protein [Scytonema sp. HK-05]|uniref:hypothetical protein n=1 Tax=Scytonema sp. HK-05 TaxID=1137095 RepID=UPI0013018CE3|nr:hypothetical protein [Scytonema sp. HK-05]
MKMHRILKNEPPRRASAAGGFPTTVTYGGRPAFSTVSSAGDWRRQERQEWGLFI